jgi:uncharacterized membrane protein (DUF373 family)
MSNGQKEPHIILRYLNRFLSILDRVVLVIVAFGILGIAIAHLHEAITDSIFFWTTHSIPHIISELMFTLILMELFRQVLRQINKQPFDLNPFLYIGFIASIRGLLLSQMGLALGDIEWEKGMMQVIVNVGVLFLLVVCYFIHARSKRAKVAPVKAQPYNEPAD